MSYWQAQADCFLAMPSLPHGRTPRPSWNSRGTNWSRTSFSSTSAYIARSLGAAPLSCAAKGYLWTAWLRSAVPSGEGRRGHCFDYWKTGADQSFRRRSSCSTRHELGPHQLRLQTEAPDSSDLSSSMLDCRQCTSVVAPDHVAATFGARAGAFQCA